MTLVANEKFDRLIVHLNGDPGIAQSASPVTMRLTKQVYWTGDPEDRIPPNSYEDVAAATWADVLAVVTTETLDEIKLAVDAELAARAP
jgi:hypothetical protein